MKTNKLMILLKDIIIFICLVSGMSTINAGELGTPPDFTVSATEKTEALKGVISQLNAFYIYPDIAKKMGNDINKRTGNHEYDSITSAKEFSKKLEADLFAVCHDKHLRIFYDKNGVPNFKYPRPKLSDQEKHKMYQDMSKMNFGFNEAKIMPGNIGYLNIRGFLPLEFGADTASAAMTFIANAGVLIVDLRHNFGGDPAMVAYTLSYLFDQPTHLNNIYERDGKEEKLQQWWSLTTIPGIRYGGTKPVYVLTSKDTFSAGEEFAYNLKNLKRATLIGETTGGGANPQRAIKVSEHFAIGVPFARANNPITNTNWEGVGVTPEIAVPPNKALYLAYKMSLEAQLKHTSDPKEIEQLKKYISKSTIHDEYISDSK
jgi:hypothetical protein